MKNIATLAAEYLENQSNVFSEQELSKYNSKIKKKFWTNLDIMSTSEIRKILTQHPKVLDTKEDEIHGLFFSVLTNDLSKNRIILREYLDQEIKFYPTLSQEFKGVDAGTTLINFCVEKDLDKSFCYLLMHVSNPDSIDKNGIIATSLRNESKKILSFIKTSYEPNEMQEVLLNIYSDNQNFTRYVLSKTMNCKVSGFKSYNMDLSFTNGNNNYLKATAKALISSPYDFLPEQKRMTDNQYDDACYERLMNIKNLIKYLTIDCRLNWHEKQDNEKTVKEDIIGFFEFQEKNILTQSMFRSLKIDEFLAEIDKNILDRSIEFKTEKTKKLKI